MLEKMEIPKCAAQKKETKELLHRKKLLGKAGNFLIFCVTKKTKPWERIDSVASFPLDSILRSVMLALLFNSAPGA